MLAKLAIALTVVAGCLIGIFGEGQAPYPTSRILVFTLYVGVTTLPLWYRLPGVGILHPLYLISAYFFLKSTIPNVNLSVIGLDYHPALRNLPANRIALLQIQVTGIYILAQIFTYLGYYSTSGIQWKFVRFEGKRSVLFWGGLGALLVGLLSFYLLLDLSGGLFPHLKNITRGASAKHWVKDPAYASAYVTLSGLLVIPPAFWMLGGRNPWNHPGFWVLAATAIATGFLSSGRRSGVVSCVVILVACWILRTRKISLGRIGIAWLLLFLSVGILGDYRRSNWDGQRRVNLDAFKNNSFTGAFQQSWEDIQTRRGGSPMYVILERVPDKIPYMYGLNYVRYINRFIPRRIWPDKPEGVAMKCAEVFYGRHNAGAIPPGAAGEAYWSGGVIAIIVVFFAWGRILRSIGNFYLKFRYSEMAALLYLVTVTRLQPEELSFGGWVYLVVPTCALLMFFGEIRRAQPT